MTEAVPGVIRMERTGPQAEPARESLSGIDVTLSFCAEDPELLAAMNEVNESGKEADRG